MRNINKKGKKKSLFFFFAISHKIFIYLSSYSSKWLSSFFYYICSKKKERQDWLNANRCDCSHIVFSETGKSRRDIESSARVLDESSRLFFFYYRHRTEKKEMKKTKEKFFSLLRFFFLFVPAYNHFSALCIEEEKKEKNECNSIVKLSAVWLGVYVCSRSRTSHRWPAFFFSSSSLRCRQVSSLSLSLFLSYYSKQTFNRCHYHYRRQRLIEW